MNAQLIDIHFRAETSSRVDGSMLTWDRLSNKSLDEIKSFPIDYDSRKQTLGEVASIRIDNFEANSLILRGDLNRVDHLASNTSQATTLLIGDVGDFAGVDQSGGNIIILGNAGDHAAMGRRGGLLQVNGNCGDSLACPHAGMKSGMRGGDVIVHGNVGDRAFERMRRGTALVSGNIGSYVAHQWIAGTIVGLGEIGEHFAIGMRRGSLILKSKPTLTRASSWSDARSFELSFLPLVWRYLSSLRSSVDRTIHKLFDWLGDQDGPDLSTTVNGPHGPIPIPTTRWASRRIGDLTNSGRGEILVLERLSTEFLRAHEVDVCE